MAVESWSKSPVTEEQLETIKGSDVAKDDHIEGNALLVDKNGNIRRLPIPSNNPNDPLNFTWWEKFSVIFCCCWFSVNGLALAGSLGPILGTFFQLYGPDGYGENDIPLLLSVPSMCIGLGNYIILPASLAWGRRPALLISGTILFAATIAAALQNSFNGHLAARIVQGLASGCAESLLPLMLTEVTFLHQRGLIFGVYWMVQGSLSAVMLIVASYINDALGWRWYYWVYVITIGAGLIFAFFGAFETRFSRPAVNIDGRVVITDEFGVTRVVADSEAQEYLDQMGPASAEEERSDEPKQTYLQMLHPWPNPHPRPWHMIFNSWARMAESLGSPAIIYVILVSSITLGAVINISLTYQAVLVGRGWQEKDVGLINVGSIVGAFLALAYCVFVGDRFVLWMAKRNRGVHRPEHRLVVLAIPCLVGFAMILMYGFTAESGSSAWGPVMAYSIYEYSFVCVLIITSTFAAESSPKHPGPALVMSIGTKNIVSFGVTKAFPELMAWGQGYAKTFGLMAGLFLAISILGIPVYLLNPKWREWESKREAKKGITSSD
ncbi:MFS general substrate transporter [Thozetella sp. PMI_491]|nr:MFS general substrate transporter [Thozetella sp. PMI_491]